MAGHEFLTNIGTCHRDISPGNLFLCVPEDNGGIQINVDGFLADVELASVPNSSTETRIVPAPSSDRKESGAFVIQIPSNNPLCNQSQHQSQSTHSKSIEVPSSPQPKLDDARDMTVRSLL